MAKEFAKPFYNSKAWRDTRQLIIERDRGRCQECGCAANEVDHIDEQGQHRQSKHNTESKQS